MKATLKKAWLEGLMQLVSAKAGPFGGMGHTPKMVADFRVSLVTVIALNTATRLKSKLSSGNALYPEFGYVFPEAELSTRRAPAIKCTTSSWSTPPSASTLSSI